VNLSGGAAAARNIEEFGRKKYKEDGGSDRDWEQYLAVTGAPGANAAMASAPSTARTQAAAATKSRSKNVSATKTGKAKDKTAVAKNRTPARNSKGGWTGEPEPPAESTAAANSLPPISEGATEATARTGPPVSLGILLETSMTGKGTRSAIVHSLTDLVRRLGPEDEAFILSFSHDLVFEEDLTGNADRLEHALDKIKPDSGTALLDAAGFAAGHLRRIAKNDSRVLLVISDGKNANSRIPALASSSEIRASGVKIYCIGVDVSGTDGMYRLQGLASATGGAAAFITAPGQFRAAAQQLAGHMGIRFDY
jgi:von Willebrand factor type A domain